VKPGIIIQIVVENKSQKKAIIIPKEIFPLYLYKTNTCIIVAKPGPVNHTAYFAQVCIFFALFNVLRISIPIK